MSTIMYTFNLRTYETTGSRTAQIVGGKELTISAAATPVPTGPDKTGHTQVYKPKGTARWIYDPQSLDVASQGEHGTWYYIADHRQHMDSKGTKQGGTPFWLPADGDDYTSPPRYMDSLGPLPDGAVTERPEKPAPTLEEAKASATAKVDAATSAAIMTGFNCVGTPPDANTPETLHFSYDSFDQQNFADSAIAMMAASSGGSMPTSTPWNAYRNWTAESGGDLVVLQLTATTFLPLYTAALTHKATKMAEGSARKAQVEAAQDVEAVNVLLQEWKL